MESENEVIRKHYGILAPSEIAAMLPGRSRRAVCTQAGRLGLGGSYMHAANHLFFEEPTPLASYWAGFIAADGCICPKNNSIVISLCADDAAHLERFRQDVGYAGPVRMWTATGGYKPGAMYAGVSVYAVPEWLSALADNYRIGPRKTKTLMPPELNETNSAAYIAGFLDGDGSIHASLNSWSPGSLTISVGGRRAILEWIKAWFDLWAPRRYNIRPANVSKVKRNFWHYGVSGGRATAIWEKFSAMGLPLMQRKWGKFQAA